MANQNQGSDATMNHAIRYNTTQSYASIEAQNSSWSDHRIASYVFGCIVVVMLSTIIMIMIYRCGKIIRRNRQRIKQHNDNMANGKPCCHHQKEGYTAMVHQYHLETIYEDKCLSDTELNLKMTEQNASVTFVEV